MQPVFFEKSSKFRTWLKNNHDTASEILVGFYKVNSGKPSMTWSESVDEALCYGWIDGIRKSRDNESYTIRFTPRKKDSIWSAVNLNKVAELIKLNKMCPAGLSVYEMRKESKSKIYSYENEPVCFDSAAEDIFKRNTKAWDFFETLAPSYKKSTIFWVMNAKQEATKYKRLAIIIAECEMGINRYKNNPYAKK